MIHTIKLSLFVCALGLVPSLAAADEPSLREWTQNRVQTGLVNRLAAKEADGPRLTRSRQAPKQIGSRSQIGGRGHSSRQTRQIHPFRSRSASAAAHHRHQRTHIHALPLEARIKIGIGRASPAAPG